jgi:hypothetical protein
MERHPRRKIHQTQTAGLIGEVRTYVSIEVLKKV